MIKERLDSTTVNLRTRPCVPGKHPKTKILGKQTAGRGYPTRKSVHASVTKDKSHSGKAAQGTHRGNAPSRDKLERRSTPLTSSPVEIRVRFSSPSPRRAEAPGDPTGRGGGALLPGARLLASTRFPGSAARLPTPPGMESHSTPSGHEDHGHGKRRLIRDRERTPLPAGKGRLRKVVGSFRGILSRLRKQKVHVDPKDDLGGVFRKIITGHMASPRAHVPSRPQRAPRTAGFQPATTAHPGDTAHARSGVGPQT